MRSSSTTSIEAELASFHEHLEAHFGRLRDLRSGSRAPLFALEHDLSDGEVDRLKESVSGAVAQGEIRHDNWLPLVVYATEIGYAYAGSEYWPTFELCTPGWAEHGDRDYIRERFQEFRTSF